MNEKSLEKYKKLHELWYNWEFSVEWLLNNLPDHLSEPFIDFEYTYRLFLEKRVGNSYDVFYFNARRDPIIKKWFGEWYELLYILSDMWIWLKENNYIHKSSELECL